MYQLYIANKNYSSWSLRTWLLMRELRISFQESPILFGDSAAWEAYRKVSPTGKVPCLVDGAVVVWESLAIMEYLAERHAGVWSSDLVTRAWARSAAAEMHAGFPELRRRCPMSCGVRVNLDQMTPELERDLGRIEQLWSDGLARFGGPYLAGAAFSAVDASFAPVVFRIQTYGLNLDHTAASYVSRMLGLPGMKEWYTDSLYAMQRDEAHDAAVMQAGKLTQDLRGRYAY
jgi:glutathione S-transferase